MPSADMFSFTGDTFTPDSSTNVGLTQGHAYTV